jgi:hypothetical protein
MFKISNLPGPSEAAPLSARFYTTTAGIIYRKVASS